MKKMTTAFLAIALSVPAIGFAQGNQQQDDKVTQQHANQAAQTSETGGSTQPKQTMSGMVSNNGNTLTSNDKSYIVNNPNSLQGYDDKSVTVVFLFNTDQNTIHILSVTAGQ